MGSPSGTLVQSKAVHLSSHVIQITWLLIYQGKKRKNTSVQYVPFKLRGCIGQNPAKLSETQLGVNDEFLLFSSLQESSACLILLIDNIYNWFIF